MNETDAFWCGVLSEALRSISRDLSHSPLEPEDRVHALETAADVLERYEEYARATGLDRLHSVKG